MTAFSSLSAHSMEVVREVLREGTIFNDGDSAKWHGSHTIHVRVDQCCFALDNQIDAWLMNRLLPRSLQFDPADFNPVPSKVCKILIRMKEIPQWEFKPELEFACRCCLSIEGSTRVATIESWSDMCLVGSREMRREYGVVHLCAGAFNGWHQAAKSLGQLPHQPRCKWSISVDHDLATCQVAAQNVGVEVTEPPFDQPPPSMISDMIIWGDVKDTPWAAMVADSCNVGWTISFPCPPFSKGNHEKSGINHREGKVLLHILTWARKAQPLFLALENVDGLAAHEHFRILKLFIRWAGYKLKWTLVHDMSQISPSYRKRWLAVAVRCDIVDSWPVQLDPVFVEQIPSWHCSAFDFPLPESLKQQLTIDEHLSVPYGRRDMLPKAKREGIVPSSSPSQVLQARVTSKEEPLPTLVASYSSQHRLPSKWLEASGIFADLLVDDSGNFCFQSPALWTIMLGNAHTLHLPRGRQKIFHMLGNAISVTHASMTLLVALKEVDIYSSFFSIKGDVIKVWESKLTAENAICVETSAGFAIRPIHEICTQVLKRTHQFCSHGDVVCTIEWPDGEYTTHQFASGALVEQVFKGIAIPDHLFHVFALAEKNECPITRGMILPHGKHWFRIVFLPDFNKHAMMITQVDCSPTPEWMATQGKHPCPSSDHGRNVAPRTTPIFLTTIVITLPSGVTKEVEVNVNKPIRDVLEGVGLDAQDLQNIRVFCGDTRIMIDDICLLHPKSHLVIDAEVPAMPEEVDATCVVEVIKPTGVTCFLRCDHQISIRQRLLDAAFPVAMIDTLRVSYNGKLVDLSDCIATFCHAPLRLLHFPLKGGGGPGKGASKGADTLQQNDPWARPSGQASQKTNVRWEQLRLCDDHQFYCQTANKQLNQVSFMQLGPETSGIAFTTKSALANLTQVNIKATSVVLLPAFKGIGDLQIGGKFIPFPPQQITVKEPGGEVQYKRLVIPVVLKGSLLLKMHEPTNVISVDEARFVEMTLDVHTAYMQASTKASMVENPLECFRRLVAGLGISMQEIAIYSYRRVKHKDDHEAHQTILKLPFSQLIPMLKASGSSELFTRQFVQADQELCHSVIPRFFNVSQSEAVKAIQLGAALEEGFRGLALTNKGLAIRCDNKCIGAARTMILQSDIRFNATNKDVVIRCTYLAQGYPFNMSHDGIIETVKQGANKAAIPLRSFRLNGLITWVLGFEQHPDIKKYTIKVAGAVHEILLTEQAQMKPVKQVKRVQKASKKENTAPARFETYAPANTTTSIQHDDSRVQTLERKVAQLEVGQSQLSQRMDGRFDQMANQLQQVLAAVCPSAAASKNSRDNAGGAGETPPPKHGRHM
eukprot:Skav219917  [mRNA]  locus=scaffold2006:81597:85595:- [translate_table: standard]